jgi:hypothetical protein
VGELVIDRLYRGPDDSANGGYACGRIAALAGGTVEVTLRRPPPLGVPLRADGGRVTDCDALVAEYGPVDVHLELPTAPAWEEAVEAQRPDVGSPFPHCFVCGVRRAPDEGLHIHPGPVGATLLVAAPWVARPDTAAPEFVWCALDCPGAYACLLTRRGTLVLGRLAARVLRAPEAGERCVVAGWQLGAEGRKLEAGTALWSGDELLGYARATWIEPRATDAA